MTNESRSHSGPWQLVGSEIVLSSPWLRVARNRYRRPDGEEVGDYYVVAKDDFVLVVAECDERVALVRQYRPATHKWYVAVPAGYIEPSESPLEAAARELLEETGLRAVNLQSLGTLDPLPGYVASRAHVVRCRVDCHRGPAVHDDQEVDSAWLASWDEVREGIISGQIDEMQSAAALLLVLAHRRSL